MNTAIFTSELSKYYPITIDNQLIIQHLETLHPIFSSLVTLEFAFSLRSYRQLLGFFGLVKTKLVSMNSCSRYFLLQLDK